MHHLPAIRRICLVVLVILLGLPACTAPDRASEQGAPIQPVNVNEQATPIQPDNVSRVSPITQWQTEKVACGEWSNTCGISSLAFSPDGQFLAFGEWDGTVRLRRTADGTELWKHREGRTPATAIIFSPDGTIVATCSNQGVNEVRLWRTGDGELLRAFDDPEVSDIHAMAFSPDGSILATGGAKSPIHLWQVEDGVLLRSLDYPTDRTSTFPDSLAFAPDGQTLAAAMGGWAGIWRLSDGVLLHTIEPDWGAFKVAFQPDGQTVVLISGDSFYLWRANNGISSHHAIQYPSGYGQDSSGVVLTNWEKGGFTPDRQLFVAESDDGVIWLWRVRDGKPVRKLTGDDWQPARKPAGQMANVSTIVFSPDGTLMASGSEKGAIQFWGIR